MTLLAQNWPPMSQAPFALTPLGYKQITSLASAVGLSPPTGAVLVLISVEAQAVRWRDDGTAPTASVGQPVAAATAFEYSGDLSAIQFIQQAGGAIINVSFFK